MSEPTILNRIQADMAVAMKSRDAATLSTLRMLKSGLMEAKTRKSRDEELTPTEEVEVVQRYAKKRREAIEEFRRVGRDDLVGSEEQEIQVASRYLPQGLSEDELRALIGEVVAASGAAGPRDAGKVIGGVMARAKGRVEGGAVARLVREILGA